MRTIANRIRHLIAAYPSRCPSCKCITQTTSDGYCSNCLTRK